MDKQDKNKNNITSESAGLSKKAGQLETLSAKEVGIREVSQSAGQEYAVWVRALLQNWRQGTVASKARSEVSYTNKKPWKQKGTGRARAGSARSPLWRGGGVTFGPQARTKTLKVNKKSKKHVLCALVWEYINHKMLYSLDWQLQQDQPSTSLVHKAFASNKLSDKKVTLFLNRDDINHWMSVRNLANVQVLAFDDVNAYELTLGNCIVVLKKDFDLFKDMVKAWN